MAATDKRRGTTKDSRAKPRASNSPRKRTTGGTGRVRAKARPSRAAAG